MVTATGNGHTLAVFWHNERAYAVDNRCPHMGFPLAQGICEDGVLTCYWHYARLTWIPAARSTSGPAICAPFR